MAHLGDVGLGELLQHVLTDEPTVGNLHGRESSGLAKLGDSNVLCAKPFRCLTSGYELVFYLHHNYYLLYRYSYV
jgi:hypothetical protein